ncbi:OLC1v1028949C1 [Oldenlandia corymbosa var. corymbosa]|uniref:OLC1v1028949C1 n=1 Tax=Oldenlandia corymbosa var. corymbosa TaxID=529605 RepID=A0AAV1CFR9_OLDCO|nr:OLC1v1028949C1 [Oldenlandia corymbosa var. corymbosa]
MGFNPQTETPSSPSHLYSQELQLKLYQAFIFSIPILFSIILFLLFYLFYLKKRVTSITSGNSANHPQQNSDRRAAVISSLADGLDLEEICKEKLPVILYDENSKSRETLSPVLISTTNASAAATFPQEPIPSAENDQPLNQSPGTRMVYAEQPQQLAEVVLRVEVCASEGSSSRNNCPDESVVVISIQS